MEGRLAILGKGSDVDKIFRFTQTESAPITYRTDGGRGNETTTTAIAMFEPAQVQPQVYIATTVEKKDGEKTEFPFCYNVNMIQKVPVSVVLLFLRIQHCCCSNDRCLTGPDDDWRNSWHCCCRRQGLLSVRRWTTIFIQLCSSESDVSRGCYNI